MSEPLVVPWQGRQLRIRHDLMKRWGSEGGATGDEWTSDANGATKSPREADR